MCYNIYKIFEREQTMESKAAKKALGKNLRSARKACGYEVVDVVRVLHEQFGLEVAEKTIYGWETSTASPTSIMLGCLCRIYHITSTRELFNGAFDEIHELPIKERKIEKEKTICIRLIWLILACRTL